MNTIELITKFNAVQKEHGFTTAWSLFDKPNLDEVAHEGTYEVAYHGGWGSTPTPITVTNPTYLDLWAAADKLIVESEDTHHTFIEAFDKIKNEGTNILLLHTGS